MPIRFMSGIFLACCCTTDCSVEVPTGYRQIKASMCRSLFYYRWENSFGGGKTIWNTHLLGIKRNLSGKNISVILFVSFPSLPISHRESQPWCVSLPPGTIHTLVRARAPQAFHCVFNLPRIFYSTVLQFLPNNNNKNSTGPEYVLYI